jgi:hypothetical protein
MASVPSSPRGGLPAWSAYSYAVAWDAGTFTITATGDGTTITAP